MRFSERQGFKRVREILQTDSIDEGLRSRLWNVFMHRCINAADSEYLYRTGKNAFRTFCAALWHDYFKRPTDEIPDLVTRTIEEIRKYFFNCNWYEVYDFVEFVAHRPI